MSSSAASTHKLEANNRSHGQVLDLIVHADDFGISERVNNGILEAHLKGVLTSTSIMASGKAFDHAVAICASTKSLDVGIHLTLVEERSILDPALISSLVNENGRFHRHATVFAKKYFQRKIDLDEVRRELDSQIRKVLATGLQVSHLDSHQHLHMLPGVLKITLELARTYNIPCVRFPRESIRPYMFRKLSSAGRIAQLGVLNLFCGMGKRGFGKHTEHFAGFYHGGALNGQNLLDVISHLPSSGACELMCHPGQIDPDAAHTHWGYNWSDELDALTSPDVAAAIEARGIRLISYRDLAADSTYADEASP